MDAEDRPPQYRYRRIVNPLALACCLLIAVTMASVIFPCLWIMNFVDYLKKEGRYKPKPSAEPWIRVPEARTLVFAVLPSNEEPEIGETGMESSLGD